MSTLHRNAPPCSPPALQQLSHKSRQLRDDLRDAAKLPPSERENKLRDLKQRFEPLLQSIKNGKGLRIDGTIMHPASGEVVWYDTTSVHSTCKKYLTAEVSLTRKRLNAGKEATKLRQAHKRKLDRYARLDGLRSVSPMILPVAVSSHGEFCAGARRLGEWLTDNYYARLLLEGDRDDGMSADDLASAFRRDYRASLLVTTMKGTADILTTAGLPFHKKNALTPLAFSNFDPSTAPRGTQKWRGEERGRELEGENHVPSTKIISSKVCNALDLICTISTM